MKINKLSLCILLLMIFSMFVTVSADESISKQITIRVNTDLCDLDPVTLNQNSDIWILNLFYEGLCRVSDDGKLIEPFLADSWEISEDGLTYIFHLKKGVKFSDGNPVTAEDWVWSFLRARDYEESYWRFSAKAIENVTAPDNNTLIIKLKEHWAPFLADLTMFNLTVQQKAYYDKVGKATYSQEPIGTGPYVLKEWKKGEYVLFEKNPYYRIEGLPKTEQIKLVLILDDNTTVLQLKAGQLDIATFAPFSKMKELDDNPNLVAIGVPSTSMTYFITNNTMKPFDDLRVRLAMDYGTDKQAIINFLLFGYGEVATTYAPKAGLYFNYSIKDRGYDIEKAKALLAEAGYPDGFEIEFLARTGQIHDERLAVLLKEQWSKIGITVNILSLEDGTVMQKLMNKQYHVTSNYWTDDMNDPSQRCEYVFGKNYMFTGWKGTARSTELLNQGNIELDIEKRRNIYLELQQIYHDVIPFTPLYYAPFPVAMSKNIEGFIQVPLGNYRFENLVKNLR